VGIGAAWLWSLLERRPLARTTALAVLAIVLLIPAMRERWTYYAFNSEWLGDTRAALAADTDARDLIARVRELGGGRVYAGMRNNWGESLGFGLPFRGVKLYNPFAFERVPSLAPPYRGASVPSDVIWDFREGVAADYDLFGARVQDRVSPELGRARRRRADRDLHAVAGHPRRRNAARAALRHSGVPLDTREGTAPRTGGPRGPRRARRR